MNGRFVKYSSRLVLIAVALAAYGCAQPNAPSTSSLNLGEGPDRNTDLARKLTLEAVDLIDQSKWTEGQAKLLKAVDADVTFGPAHNNLGTVYLHENNLYQAAWEFQYAAKLMPYQPEPRSNLGLALEAAGKLDDAVDYYDQALKIEPDNPQYVGNAARARIRRGDKDAKVRDLLTKLVSVDTRPDWVQWAREKLALLGPLPATDLVGQP
jgi:Flp pilus assembly protein TadD